MVVRGTLPASAVAVELKVAPCRARASRSAEGEVVDVADSEVDATVVDAEVRFSATY